MQHAPSEPAKTKPSRYRHNILTKAWFITVRLLSCVVKMHSEGNRCYCWWCDRDSDVETLIYTQNNRPVWWTSVPSITCFFNLFALLYLKFKFWMTLKFSKLSSCLDTVDVILTKGIRKKKMNQLQQLWSIYIISLSNVTFICWNKWLTAMSIF